MNDVGHWRSAVDPDEPVGIFGNLGESISSLYGRFLLLYQLIKGWF
jgi:hypothetical protein